MTSKSRLQSGKLLKKFMGEFSGGARRSRRLNITLVMIISAAMIISTFSLVFSAPANGNTSTNGQPFVSPSVSILNASSVAYIGSQYNLTIGLSESVTSLSINWGDGSTTALNSISQGTYTADHTYQNPGSYYIFYTADFSGTNYNNSNDLISVHTYGETINQNTSIGMIKLEPNNSSSPVALTSRAFLPGSHVTFAVGYYSDPLNSSYEVTGQNVILYKNGAVAGATGLYYTYSTSADAYVPLQIEPVVKYSGLQSGYYTAVVNTNTSGIGSSGSIIQGTQTSSSYYYDFFVGDNVTQYASTADQPTFVSAEQSPIQPTQLDGALAYEQSSLEVLYNIYQTLVTYNGSNSTQFEPELATNLPSVSNGEINSNYFSYSAKTTSGVSYTVYMEPYQNYTFYLRQNATFQNGVKITPWDMLNSIARTLLFDGAVPGTPGWILAQYLLPGNYYASNTFYNITQNITIDNASNSITFHFQHPTSPTLVFDLLTAPGSFVMDASWLASNGRGLSWSSTGFQAYKAQGNENNNGNYYLSTAMASGPYEIKYLQQASYVVLTKNPKFASPGSWYRVPYYTSVKILYFSEPSSETQLMGSGAADSIAYAMNGSVNNLIKAGNASTYEFPTLSIFFYNFNANINTSMLHTITPSANVPQTFFDSQLVRRTFAYSYDYSQFIQQDLMNASGGLKVGQRYAGVLPSGMAYNQSIAQLNATTEGVPYYSIAQAKSYWNEFQNGSGSLFSAMGLTRAANGSITYNGNPLVIPIFIPTGDPTDMLGATAWANTLKKVISGASFPITQVSFLDLFSEYLIQGSDPMPISWGGWAPDYPYPTDYIGPLGDPSNTSTYLAPNDITPYWFGNSASGNPLVGQQNMIDQASNFTAMNNDYNNMTYYPPGNEAMAHAINEMYVNETLSVRTYELDEILVMSPSVSATSVKNYNENPFITTSGELEYYNLYSAKYTVTFHQNGLPAGTAWYVNLSHGQSYQTTSSSISFQENDGTYAYSIGVQSSIYSPSSSAGTFNVSGAPVSVSVLFLQSDYNVTFVESGIPTGSQWDINDSQAYNVTGEWFYQTTTNSISIYLPDGTYTFYAMDNSLNLVRKFNFTVDGSSATVNINFQGQSSKNQYRVIFTEKGLPAGTSWEVKINGSISQNTSSSMFVQLANGTYSYTVYPTDLYVPLKRSGSVTVVGSNVTVSVSYEKKAFVYLNLTPVGTNYTLGQYSYTSNGKATTGYYAPGDYIINATHQGYRPYSNSYSFLSGKSYYINITLQKETVYGILKGSVSPGNATVMANGIALPVVHGELNESLSAGTYYVTASAFGFSTFSTSMKIKNNTVTWLNITLQKSTTSYLVYGYISPNNASVTINGTTAYVNSTGYYEVTVPGGSYVISFYAPGYFALSKNITVTKNMEANATLKIEPPPTSIVTSGNVTASGFNVTIANITISSGMVNLTYNANANGTLSISLPYSLVSNLTVSQLLDSKVYINGTAYSNFTVTITSNYTVILTVTGLNGDPVITWVYNPAVKIPSPPAKPGSHPSLLDYYALAGVAAVIVIISVGLAVSSKRRKTRRYR